MEPTPTNESYIWDGNWIINVSSDQPITSCYLDWELTNNITMKVNGTYCYIENNSVVDGVYYYRVWAGDSSNNWNVTEQRVIYNDKPVNITIVFPPNGSRYANLPVNINVTTDDPADYCSYDINKTQNITLNNDSSTNWFAEITSLSDGDYNLTIWCNDTSGNWSSKEIFFAFGLYLIIELSDDISEYKLNISSGNLTFNYTTQTVYWYNATPEYQNTSIGIWNVTNGNIDTYQNIYVYLNQTVPCMNIWVTNTSSCLLDTSCDNSINLSLSPVFFYNLSASTSIFAWNWIDMINCSLGLSYEDIVIFKGEK